MSERASAASGLMRPCLAASDAVLRRVEYRRERLKYTRERDRPVRTAPIEICAVPSSSVTSAGAVSYEGSKMDREPQHPVCITRRSRITRRRLPSEDHSRTMRGDLATRSRSREHEKFRFRKSCLLGARETKINLPPNYAKFQSEEVQSSKGTEYRSNL